MRYMSRYIDITFMKMKRWLMPFWTLIFWFIYKHYVDLSGAGGVEIIEDLQDAANAGKIFASLNVLSNFMLI